MGPGFLKGGRIESRISLRGVLKWLEISYSMRSAVSFAIWRENFKFFIFPAGSMRSQYAYDHREMNRQMMLVIFGIW